MIRKNFNKSHILVALGADDPEMARVEHWLRRCDIEFVYATKKGQRVSPSEAYAADNNPEIFQGRFVIFVECDINGVTADEKADHHNVGDFGHSLDHEDYVIASSLGQLLFFLLEFGCDIHFEKKDFIVMAMDHCAPAAMRGLCEGVAAVDAHRFALTEMARNHDVEPSVFLAIVNQYRTIVKDQQKTNVVVLGGQAVCFLADISVGEFYSLRYHACRYAAMVEGTPVIIPVGTSSGTKIHLVGAEEKTVRHFMRTTASHGIPGSGYGVPQRGYAGVVVKPGKRASSVFKQMMH